jgi:hypothetical protein
VDILDRYVFPGIRSRVLFSEVVSSMDVERDTAGEMANAYGRRLTVREVMKGTIDEDDRPVNSSTSRPRGTRRASPPGSTRPSSYSRS